MTQNRSSAIVFQASAAALFILWMFTSPAQAQPAQAKPVSITGVYNGSYAGEQGATKFKLTLTQQDNGMLGGTFTLYLPDGADTKAFTCDVRGLYLAANRMVQLVRGKWETAPPAGVDNCKFTVPVCSMELSSRIGIVNVLVAVSPLAQLNVPLVLV